MLAHFTVLPQSVFSPARQPISVRYVRRPRAKPAAKAVVHTVAPAQDNITTILGTDELDSVMMAVYQSCKSAPMCAAVSREFKRAKEIAEEDSKALNVAPPRLQMKLASNPSLVPAAAKDD